MAVFVLVYNNSVWSVSPCFPGEESWSGGASSHHRSHREKQPRQLCLCSTSPIWNDASASGRPAGLSPLLRQFKIDIFIHWYLILFPCVVPQRASSMQVKALYNFTAEEDDELGFSAGDVIEVLDCSDESWWKGRLRGKSGLFPANYTTQLWENTSGDAPTTPAHMTDSLCGCSGPEFVIFEHKHWADGDSSNLCTTYSWRRRCTKGWVSVFRCIFTCTLPLSAVLVQVLLFTK